MRSHSSAGIPEADDAFTNDAVTSPSSPTSKAIADALLGLLVDDRYQVKHRLARGGMASVYIAHDTRLDRPVAMKVMHQHLAEDPQFLQRFTREARSAARIVHPGVVSVFDQGSVDGRPYLVMDLIDGPTIRDLLRREGSFTLARSLSYCDDILQALRAAHRIGVIHRDIKPENVLLPHEGSARVTDFGLARAVSDATMSVTGNMLGTVTYMAPEVATNGETDARTDLYSVGIMLYEMLTGAVPWHGDNALHIAYSHVHDDVPAPSDEQPWIPREVDDFVAALCARNPQERLSSADEAIALLGRVVATIPPGLSQRRADIAPSPVNTGDHTALISLPAHTAILPAVSSPSTVASASTSRGAQEKNTSSSDRQPSGVSHPAGTVSEVTPPLISSPTVSHRNEQGDGPLPSPQKMPVVERNKRPLILVLIALVVLSLIGAGTGWWWNEYGPGSYLPLPTTTGRAATDVRADLEALGFTVKEEESFSDSVIRGVVISSQPTSGSSAHKTATITLIVSKGPDLRTVPDLTKKPLEEARQLLEQAGLLLGEQHEDWSEDIPAQAIISQSEAPDVQLKVDSTVDVVVSKGRQPRDVPDLTNKTFDEAKAALEELELGIEAREAHSDSVEKGRIISQEPSAQTQLYRGDTVNVMISLGPEMVEVPNVFGKSEAEAVTMLKDAGFHVEVKRQLGGVFRTAHSTEPGSGTSLPKGSTIILNII